MGASVAQALLPVEAFCKVRDTAHGQPLVGARGEEWLCYWETSTLPNSKLAMLSSPCAGGARNDGREIGPGRYNPRNCRDRPGRTSRVAFRCSESQDRIRSQSLPVPIQRLSSAARASTPERPSASRNKPRLLQISSMDERPADRQRRGHSARKIGRRQRTWYAPPFRAPAASAPG